MDLVQKKTLVTELKSHLDNMNIVLIGEYSGINVANINEFRTEAKSKNISVRVIKNKLFSIAIENTKFDHLKDNLSGQNIFIMSTDPVDAAKLVSDFANNNENFNVKVGSYNNDLLDNSSITALSKMPSLDELRAGIISFINTPATRIAQIIKEPMNKVARVINAYSNKA